MRARGRLGVKALREFAIARSLAEPGTLRQAIDRLGFVQADPIRAPARAQDLILRQRVRGYRAGGLERAYARLAVEEEYFVNYGFLPLKHVRWLHPRTNAPANASLRALGAALLTFVRERGEVHPREADAHFKAGRVRRWSAQTAATTHMLDHLHFVGELRVARRDGGIRVYAPRTKPVVRDAHPSPSACAAGLLRLLVQLYAPVPAPSLVYLCRLLRFSVPHLEAELRAALASAHEQFAHARIDGTLWYWPAGEDPRDGVEADDGAVRCLAPFDPIVWDRRRFEWCWGWTYRFEAYTPPAKRQFGYYALPMLWRTRMVGWANLHVEHGQLHCAVGFAGRAPRERAFRRELDGELDRLRQFLALPRPPPTASIARVAARHDR